jgi:hypothetical protein
VRGINPAIGRDADRSKHSRVARVIRRMTRRRLVAVPLAIVLFLAACSSGDSESARPLPGGTAITVGDTEISAARFVRELRVIAANRELARVLKREDDTTLVPKPGTIDILLSQAWADASVNQVISDREFARRDLEVTPAIRRRARRNAAELFRGEKAFAAFPKSFQRLVTERQARQDALLASFPKEHEPSDADLRELYARVEGTCQAGKLIAMIYLSERTDADAIAAELAGGADFASLARERSEDADSAERGGVTMCIGSTRFNASEDAIKAAATSTPIGGVTPPLEAGDGFAILRILPLTIETAHDLLVEDWHGKHPTPLFDFLAEQRLANRITIAKRFAQVGRSERGLAIAPPTNPVRL